MRALLLLTYPQLYTFRHGACELTTRRAKSMLGIRVQHKPFSMGFLFKFVLKIVINGALLYGLNMYLSGFFVDTAYVSLLIGGLVLAFISTVIRPIVRLITAPIVWLTLGLFNLVINIGLLYAADVILPQLDIQSAWALFIASIIISLVNSIF